MESCLFSARVGIFSFIVIMIKGLLTICTLTWRVNNFVSRQGKGINMRNESTFMTDFSPFDYQLSVKIVAVIYSKSRFSVILRS